MRSLYFLMIAVFALPACNIQQREKALQLKETELKQKENELLVKERSIQLKEAELANREKLLDSVSIRGASDSLAFSHPNLPGTYNVIMKCTEATCPGSAVGDTKNEQWEISFDNNAVVVKAMSDKRLLRIYKGNIVGNTFELIAQQDNAAASQPGKMVVRLQETKANGLDGIREITRPGDCHIVYDLDLQKQ